ncbi:MAG: helix-turn-helix domain-containing protein [Nocardioidaceae bacterium]
MVVDEDAGTPLSLLGLGATEEQVYRVLLRNDALTQSELSEMSGLGVDEVRGVVDRLAVPGLVDANGEGIRANPPDQVLGRLISEETHRLHVVGEQLDALRGFLPSLVADHLAAKGPRSEPVEVELVEGGDIVRLIRTLGATSSGELLWVRPDQWRLPVSRDIDDWVRRTVRAGRRSRVIYPARVLEEAPDVVRLRAEAGEHVRILASVPCRLAIMGRSAALMPERWGSVNTGRRLVVRQEALVSALTALFESMWDRGVAVPGLDGQLDGPNRADDRRLLLDQLAGGVKDEQIARAMGLSLRTVRRRVAEMLEELGVDSRFQAGVEAVRRGWI